jgi:acyl dehydratase
MLDGRGASGHASRRERCGDAARETGVPIYFEDIEPGDTLDCGGFSLSRDAIVAFARRYDPRPFHVDEAAAAASVFGGLVASSIQVHLEGSALVTARLDPFAITAGLGWQASRFRAPAYPDTRYTVSACWSGLRLSASQPGQGVCELAWTVVAPDGATIMSFGFNMLIAQRPGSTSPA